MSDCHYYILYDHRTSLNPMLISYFKVYIAKDFCLAWYVSMTSYISYTHMLPCASFSHTTFVYRMSPRPCKQAVESNLYHPIVQLILKRVLVVSIQHIP